MRRTIKIRPVQFFIPATVLIFWCMDSFSQECTIKGLISDIKTKQPLFGVNVILDDTTGVASDVNGNYELKCQCGTHKLGFSYIGYAPSEMTVKVKPGEPLIVNNSLTDIALELGIVVVSAGKFEQKIEDVTVSMEVIKPSLVENKTTYNLETIIDQVPGVNMMDGQCNIRNGSGYSYGAGSRVLVLVDDLPMLAADANDVKWNFLPVENLEQIEVIKGASSALFGSSAMNGVINVRTAYPKELSDSPGNKPGANARVNVFHGFYFDPVRINDSTGTIYDTEGNLYKPLKWWKNTQPVYTGANFFYSKKIQNLDLIVGGNVFSDQGYRMGENEQWMRANCNTRYRFKKIDGLSAGFNVNAMRNRGGWFFIWANADSGGYVPQGGIDTATTTLSFYTTTRSNYDPYIVYLNKKGDKFSLRNRYYQTINVNNTKQGSEANFYYSEFQYQKQKENNYTATFGGVGTYTSVFSDLYGDHYGSNFAFYAQGDKRISRLSLSFGIRGEYFRIDTAETVSTYQFKVRKKSIGLPFQPVFRSGLNYRLLEETYLRASYGQGYRFPSIAEKFITTEVSALKIFPNPDLMAETGYTAEIGIKQGFKISKWKGYVDVAGFLTEYHNMMEFTFNYYVPDTVKIITPWQKLPYAGFKFNNIGNARIIGMEVTLIGQGKLGPIGTTILAGYTYTDPIDLNYNPALDTTNTAGTNVLKYRFYHGAKCDLQFDYKKFSLGSSGRYFSNILNIDRAFEEKLFYDVLPTWEFYILPGLKEYRKKHNKGSLVFDARFSYMVSDGNKISLVCNNLLNRENMGRPGDIQPPRTLSMQYTLSF